MDFCDDHLVGSSLLRTHIWFNLCTIMCIKQIGASLQFCQILGLAVAVGLNVLQCSHLGWGAVADDIIWCWRSPSRILDEGGEAGEATFVRNAATRFSDSAPDTLPGTPGGPHDPCYVLKTALMMVFSFYNLCVRSDSKEWGVRSKSLT